MPDAKGNTRRAVLLGLGASVVAASGLVAWRAVAESVFSGGMGAAYTPWRRWREQERVEHDLAFAKYRPTEADERELRSEDARRLDLVRAAHLAWSPLNTQPWKFLIASGSIEVSADDRFALPTLDPVGRERLVAIGGALQNLAFAASAYGYPVEESVVASIPGSGLVAHLSLGAVGDRKTSPLYEAIPNCHDNPGVYDGPRELDRALRAELESLTEGERTRTVLLPPARVGEATEAIVRSFEQVAAHRPSVEEIYRWFRQKREEIYQSRDGVTLDTFSLPIVEKIFLKMLPRMDRREFAEFFVERARRISTPDQMIGVITLERPGSPADYVEVGRVWQRVRLWARTKGLAVHSLNQHALGALDRVVAEPGGEERPLELQAFLRQFAPHPVVCWRMGYPRVEALPGPRRPIASVAAI